MLVLQLTDGNEIVIHAPGGDIVIHKHEKKKYHVCIKAPPTMKIDRRDRNPAPGPRSAEDGREERTLP